MRVILAFVGGFFVTSGLGSLVAILFDRINALSLVQGVHIMTLSGFLVWSAIAMWVFHERRLTVAACAIVGCAVLLPGIALWAR